LNSSDGLGAPPLAVAVGQSPPAVLGTWTGMVAQNKGSTGQCDDHRLRDAPGHPQERRTQGAPRRGGGNGVGAEAGVRRRHLQEWQPPGTAIRNPAGGCGDMVIALSLGGRRKPLPDVLRRFGFGSNK